MCAGSLKGMKGCGPTHCKVGKLQIETLKASGIESYQPGVFVYRSAMNPAFSVLDSTN